MPKSDVVEVSEWLIENSAGHGGGAGRGVLANGARAGCSSVAGLWAD